MNSNFSKWPGLGSMDGVALIKQLTDLKRSWILILITILTAFNGISQKRATITPSDATIMETAIIYDISLEIQNDDKRPQTLVLDRTVAKRSLDAINLSFYPDSIISYGFSYGTEGLIKLLNADSSWIGVIKAYNQSSGETNRINTGDLNLAGYNIKLLSNLRIQKIFKRKAGWKRFYHKFADSNGLYRVSAPIVQGNKAVLHLSHTKGALNGVGYVFLLEKTEQWEVIQLIELWVS
ncbi:MAG: hypothetical protein R2824_02755 [Saprospiraceae bacterium]|nr:hypothetical protein [Lewinella sp.]